MMDINEFTQKLEIELEGIDPGSLKPDTVYRSLKNWSSMHALIVISFIDLNFDVTLNAQDIKNTQTVNDLYNLTHKKQKGV
jgi:acyl carrier protein